MTKQQSDVAKILRAAAENQFAGIAHAHMKLFPVEYAAGDTSLADAAADERARSEFALIVENHRVPSYEQSCSHAADSIERDARRAA